MEIRSISNIAAIRPVAIPTAPTSAEPAAEPAADASTTPDASERTARTPGGFISPVLRYDQMAHVAVLFFRDFDSGETKDQIPAERVVEEYRRNALRVNGDREHPSDKVSQAAAKTGGVSTNDGASAEASDKAGGSPAGFTFTRAGVAAGAAIPAPSVAYAATPASVGSGAVVSSGATGGGVPGGLVSVTV